VSCHEMLEKCDDARDGPPDVAQQPAQPHDGPYDSRSEEGRVSCGRARDL
jgi:hypothetical protein